MYLEKSRKGPLTARFNERYIHSRYDPDKEADQLLNSFISQAEYSEKKTVIVFEPGLGYILDRLLKRHNNSKLIVFFYNPESCEYCKSQGLLENISYYDPRSEINLEDFISSVLKKQNIRDILFFELQATAALFSELQAHYQNKLLDFLSISHGSEMTKNSFALKWILNSLKNFVSKDMSGEIISIESPVILAASGPSLEKHIQRIAELKEQYTIAALPSSLEILSSYGILPDILFTTDPGFYAREHLRALDKDTIIVSSLISSLTDTDNFNCGINQNSFSEKLLFNPGEILSFPEMGTVAATALFYLMKVTKNKIYISGLDFSMEDIKMHAQPHSFTPYILKNESRLNPGYNSYFERASSMTQKIEGNFRLTKNMNTYTAWFKQQNFNDSVFRLKPAYVNLPIPELERIPECRIAKKHIRITKNRNYPDLIERRRRLKNLSQNLNNLISDYEDNNVMSPALTDFAKEVFPLFSFNSNKDNLKEPSAKSDFLYKIKYLTYKMDCISNG